MKKILVVDDERDIQLLFQQKFRKEIKSGELAFDFVFSGEAAVEYLSQGGLDIILILSDVNMPGMSGLMLLQHIKAHRPTLKVMMITAYGDEQNYKQAMSYGADDFLTKPLDFSDLRDKIKDLA